MGKRVHRCHYCKELLNLTTDNIVTFEMGKKNIKTVEAHNYCRQRVTNRKDFYDWLYKILDIPSIDKYTVMALDELFKNGYDWEVIKHAIRTKLKVIQDNFSKGMAYMCGIIRNQCPISFKEMQRTKEQINTLNDNIEIIDITKLKGRKISSKDYSKIFDGM